MAPAVTIIPQATADEARPTCSACVGELADSGLKCNNCKAFVHLRCSELPEYQLIRLSFTQASYMCLKCVKTKELDDDEEKYSAETTKIKELIAQEMSIIELAEKEANKTLMENHQNSDAADISSGANQAKKKGICHYYVNRKCKHGPKGDGCKYEHPKICRYYAKLGENRRGGCKKGEQCRFAHPKICFQAQGGWVCNRKNCHFLHPYGFKNKEVEEKTGGDENSSRPSPGELGVPNTQVRVLKRPSPNEARVTRTSQNLSENETNPAQKKDNRNDFLEMKEQLEVQNQTMKIIQQQLSLLMRERTLLGREKMDLDPLGPYQRRY